MGTGEMAKSLRFINVGVEFLDTYLPTESNISKLKNHNV